MDVKYDSTRVFGIFFILICVFLYSAVVSNIFEVISDSNDNETATKHLKLSEEEWTELISKTFASENKTISKERLILDILLKKKIVSYSDTIKPIIEVKLRVVMSLITILFILLILILILMIISIVVNLLQALKQVPHADNQNLSKKVIASYFMMFRYRLPIVN